MSNKTIHYRIILFGLKSTDFLAPLSGLSVDCDLQKGYVTIMRAVTSMTLYSKL